MKRRLFLCIAIITLPGLSRADEPRLSKHRVIRLADAAARHAGYDLHRFDRPVGRFAPTGAGHDWILLYDGKPDKDGASVIGNHFFVHVDDHDHHTSISPGR